MKKLLLIALAVVMALTVVACVACTEEETYTGYCYYTKNYGTEVGYGCVVDVTVKGDTITAVKLYTNAEALAWAQENDVEWLENTVRTTASWKAGSEQDPTNDDLGFAAAEAAYAKWIEDTFVGQKVSAVKGWTTNLDELKVEPATSNLAGATQSAIRIISAVQNALKNVK